MDDSALYLRTVDDLRSRITANDAYELLRASASIRQLVLDDPPLAHLVNRSHRIKLTFRVVEWIPSPFGGEEFSWVDVSSEYGVVWGPSQPKDVKSGEFLATKCMALRGRPFTIKDVVKSCANIRGGVHRGGAVDEKEKALLELDQLIQIERIDASVQLIRGIATSLLSGLEPLTKAISRSHKPPA
jgi:hypothetical protein